MTEAASGLEWWQRVAGWWLGWAGRHPVLARRLGVVHRAWLWLCLVWVLTLVAVVPQVREGVWVWARVFWLLPVWFWLARTKTVSWRLAAGMFTVGQVWTWLVGVASLRLTQALVTGNTVFGGRVSTLGTSVAMGGIAEETLKLVPVGVLAVMAAGRVRRFAVVDWLVVGVAAGLGFQATEELARRVTAHTTTPGLLERLLGTGLDHGPFSGYPQYGWGPLGGASRLPTTGTVGHFVSSGLITVTVGLGVAAWRHAVRLPARPRTAWRVAAVAAPVAMWVLVVVTHMGWNATAATGRGWLTAAHPSIPWPVRAAWPLAGGGAGLGPTLIVLLVVAMLLDARHLHAGDHAHSTRSPGARSTDPRTSAAGDLPRTAGFFPVPFDPAARTDAWTTRVLSTLPPRPAGPGRTSPGPAPLGPTVTSPGGTAAVARAAVAALCAMVAYLARDVAVIVAAHARPPEDSRRAALARGRAATAMMRTVREQTLVYALGPSRPRSATRVRLVALTGLAAIGLVAFWLAPACALRIGISPELAALAHAAPHWLAGKFDDLGRWWGTLSPGAKILVGVGLAALITLSGGSLGLGFGLSGAGTYLLDHAPGTATFLRNPTQATRNYLTHTTPLGLLADGAEALLTFAPGNFAGAAGGRLARQAAEDFTRDPHAWIAAQHALPKADIGAIRLDALGLKRPRTWPEALDDMHAGRAFNTAQWHRFEANEITLTNNKVLDSYNHRLDIVSRKNTQLADLEPSTATNYLRELATKYKPGEIIADTPRARTNYPHLIGKTLKGRQVLEVPMQTRPIPQDILDYATAHDIVIADVTGHIYP